MNEWISVKDKLPEDCEGIRFWREHHLEFTTVFAADVKSGSVGVINRVRQIPCGVEYLDKMIETTEWNWGRLFGSGDMWQPTHWMPIPKLPKEKEKEKENEN